MPTPYPPEFRSRAISLDREGQQVKQAALDLGIHPITLHKWLRQEDIDRGRKPGPSSQLRAARSRIRQLEQELAIVRRAAKFLSGQEPMAPKGRTR